MSNLDGSQSMVQLIGAASHWCVVRTSTRKTLALTDQLNRSGIEAWTPREVATMRTSCRMQKRIDREKAMLPTFVFVRGHMVEELLSICADPVSPYPSFSLFRHLDTYPLIADSSLQPMRRLEASLRTRRALKAKVDRFGKGERVRTTERGFAGMHGVVEQASRGFAMVAFPGWKMPIKIASFLLLPDVLDAAPDKSVRNRQRVAAIG